MISRKMTTIIAGCAATLAVAASGALSAQTRSQRLATPPVPSGPQLANPQQLPQDVQHCPGYKVDVTLRGVAVMCYERKGDSGSLYMMAIRNTDAFAAADAAVPLLMEQHAQAQAYFTNKNAKGSWLLVKHRAAGPEARAICAMSTNGASNATCREVVSLGY